MLTTQNSSELANNLIRCGWYRNRIQVFILRESLSKIATVKKALLVCQRLGWDNLENRLNKSHWNQTIWVEGRFTLQVANISRKPLKSSGLLLNSRSVDEAQSPQYMFGPNQLWQGSRNRFSNGSESMVHRRALVNTTQDIATWWTLAYLPVGRG